MTPNDLAADASQIGQFLRSAREGAGLTRAAAAARIGVDPQTLFRWERDGAIGRAELGLVLRAEAAYGVPLIPTIRRSLGIDMPRGTSEGGRWAQVVERDEIEDWFEMFRRDLRAAQLPHAQRDTIVASVRDFATSFAATRPDYAWSIDEAIALLNAMKGVVFGYVQTPGRTAHVEEEDIPAPRPGEEKKRA